VKCICCDATDNLCDVGPDFAMCSGLAVAVALHTRARLSKENVLKALCSRHQEWFRQEFKTMMDNAPVMS
jgi:hypothetical protein